MREGLSLCDSVDHTRMALGYSLFPATLPRSTVWRVLPYGPHHSVGSRPLTQSHDGQVAKTYLHADCLLLAAT